MHTVTGGTSKKKSSGDMFFPGELARTQCERIPGDFKPPRVHPIAESLELEIIWTVPRARPSERWQVPHLPPGTSEGQESQDSGAAKGKSLHSPSNKKPVNYY